MTSTAMFGKPIPNTKSPAEGLLLTPEELFAKHTISEVKTIQSRLRVEADAKQEELRLMVGERYRDLLQASTSIISIASSSEKVLTALEESKAAIEYYRGRTAFPKPSQVSGENDRSLHGLQVLSAHVKLLLDAPEHLWRLIEKRRYLHAAWLFLLARVTHRSLARKDDEDQPWAADGVDITSDFPLVQRQWELVAQFRQQIVHKSTLSLREATLSSEQVCAILITLHLLDSRPLSDTLSAFLAQRTKSLQQTLSWPADRPIIRANGHTSELVASTTDRSLREILPVMKNSLKTICETVCVARTIFKQRGTQSSLVMQVLESISSDEPSSAAKPSLPAELELTMESLLQNLTSTASLSLLPENLSKHKPYIDLRSAAASLPQEKVTETVAQWFEKSLNLWKTSAAKWLTDVQSVKDIWTLRTSARKWIAGFSLEDSELVPLLRETDALCQTRTLDLWKQNLADAYTAFKDRLRTHSTSDAASVNPVEFLFQPTPLPTLPQLSKTRLEAPFHKYQQTLKSQLVGRFTQLDEVLSSLERCARTIQYDLSHVRATSDKQSQPLVERLLKTYEPIADDFVGSILLVIEEAYSEGPSIDAIVFLSHVTNDLALLSLFSQHIGCSAKSSQSFQKKLSDIHENIIAKWTDNVISDLSQAYVNEVSSSSTSARPSPQMMQCLLSLCDGVQHLGAVYQPRQQETIASMVLRPLIYGWLQDAWVELDDQQKHDVAFIKQLASLYGQPWADLTQALADKLSSAVHEKTALDSLEKGSAEHLARTQTLLSVLIPRTLSTEAPLLQLPVNQGQQPTLDLARPSARFGMLLVDGVYS